MSNLGQAKLATGNDGLLGPKANSDLETSDFSDSRSCLATSNAANAITTDNLNVDSGSSNVLVPSSWELSAKTSSDLQILTANKGLMNASSKGQLNLSHLGLQSLTAHSVLGVVKPLPFVSEVTDAGKAVFFLQHAVLIVNNPSNLQRHLGRTGDVLAEGFRRHRSYYLPSRPSVILRAHGTVSESMLPWHLRLSHLNLRSLQDLQRGGEISVLVDNSEVVMNCEDCVHGKFSGLSWKSRMSHKVIGTLDLVHSNLCSLLSPSQKGSRYFMTFVDEASHFTVFYFLKFKSQALSCLKNFVTYSERETGQKVKVLRTDNGGKYTSKAWEVYYTDLGIKHSMGPPHSPEMNGTAERYN